MSRIPARCNRRACQARRNLSKRPAQYVRPPVCHVAGCDGVMYVDEYRLRRGEHDNAPTCHAGCLHDHGAHNHPHRYSDKRCRHYDAWLIEVTARASKHSPKFNRCDGEVAPF